MAGILKRSIGHSHVTGLRECPAGQRADFRRQSVPEPIARYLDGAVPGTGGKVKVSQAMKSFAEKLAARTVAETEKKLGLDKPHPSEVPLAGTTGAVGAAPVDTSVVPQGAQVLKGCETQKMSLDEFINELERYGWPNNNPYSKVDTSRAGRAEQRRLANGVAAKANKELEQRMAKKPARTPDDQMPSTFESFDEGPPPVEKDAEEHENRGYPIHQPTGSAEGLHHDLKRQMKKSGRLVLTSDQVRRLPQQKPGTTRDPDDPMKHAEIPPGMDNVVQRLSAVRGVDPVAAAWAMYNQEQTRIAHKHGQVRIRPQHDVFQRNLAALEFIAAGKRSVDQGAVKQLYADARLSLDMVCPPAKSGLDLNKLWAYVLMSTYKDALGSVQKHRSESGNKYKCSTSMDWQVHTQKKKGMRYAEQGVPKSLTDGIEEGHEEDDVSAEQLTAEVTGEGKGLAKRDAHSLDEFCQELERYGTGTR